MSARFFREEIGPRGEPAANGKVANAMMTFIEFVVIGGGELEGVEVEPAIVNDWTLELELSSAQ
jgi:hypothetical protein